MTLFLPLSFHSPTFSSPSSMFQSNLYKCWHWLSRNPSFVWLLKVHHSFLLTSLLGQQLLWHISFQIRWRFSTTPRIDLYTSDIHVKPHHASSQIAALILLMCDSLFQVHKLFASVCRNLKKRLAWFASNRWYRVFSVGCWGSPLSTSSVE